RVDVLLVSSARHCLPSCSLRTLRRGCRGLSVVAPESVPGAHAPEPTVGARWGRCGRRGPRSSRCSEQPPSPLCFDTCARTYGLILGLPRPGRSPPPL